MAVRKIDRNDTVSGCPVAHDGDGVWRLRGYSAGRALLRSTETVQAGMNVEGIEKMPKRIRRPVLYRDGEEHREHRRQTARYFTPRRVDAAYRALMERIADEQLDRLRRERRADLSQLSFRLAVAVAAAVMGLTGGRPGMPYRLEKFFPEQYGQPGFTSPSGVYWFARQNFWTLAFYMCDVRPAIRARRRERADDVISHLIDEGCSDGDILGECLTFAPAGMITTREFINVVAWHLFTDADLRARYMAADPAGRLAVLEELLRLEPVVSTLKRRTTAEVEVPGPSGPIAIPAGSRVDVSITNANLDPDALAAGGPGLSFGDGPHRCPGAHVALQETDIFVHRLFALDGLRMATPPRVSFKEDIAAYELRGLTVELAPQ
ncbi:cytochrome P450 [Dactylosporangium vinaceum]|uniref:Cytochrome P450 n=1 Tax=Dactylosporangium vinaceum TaxID=53362 RepID=A0ABV5M859_9ACTN|nr:cytochrome P450 [Dactylosporangium vinaceum]UAB94283.1 cytochrome P450 [Dactylosporangium vinaceum]